jgi:HTH-type transcriptional regulator/antitoxin HigA
MTRRDLEPYLGPRGRVSDILNRTRPLTLEMIRRLAEGLQLPVEVLIQPYALRKDGSVLAA